MKVILGLGNPGRQYERTRHNVGWWVLDHLADVWHFDGWKTEGQSLVANGLVGVAKVRLVKPQTFMNLSGAVLAPYLRRPFWSPGTDLLVVVDEVALPVGTLPPAAAGKRGRAQWAQEHRAAHRTTATMRDFASAFSRWTGATDRRSRGLRARAISAKRSARRFSR